MKKEKMKLWQKDILLEKKIENFTIGKDNELDLKLATFDVLGSMAHITMLTSIDLIEKDELVILMHSLKDIFLKAEKGLFEIEPGIEDVHSQVELLLTRELGYLGKKIHSGRSRNDQVLLDLRLYFRDRIQSICEKVGDLSEVLLQLSETNKDVLMPGYTHMQVAMPSSFGLWFGAYAESLSDDLKLMQSVYKIINQNPLGSAAGYGSSFPLDRQMTTELLGFDDLCYNVINAQFGRGKSELFLANGMAGMALTINKLASDICLFIGQNHSFISFPTELTTGSSIMPHKKNPDVFELIRAKTNKILSLPSEITAMISNLSIGYHRDFQILKESLFANIDTLDEILDILIFALPQMKMKENIIEDEKYKYLYSVEVVNELVLKGVPFRDAYLKVGKAIEEGDFEPSKILNHTHEGSIGNLCNKQIQEKIKKTLAEFGFEKVEAKIITLLELV